MTQRITGRLVGRGSCALCGCEVDIRENKKGRLYYHCPPEPDGCNHQDQSRGGRSTRLIAEKVTKWRSKEDRAKFLGEAAPAPEAKPAPAKKPDPAPSPAPDEGAGVPWWEKPIF